MENYTGGQANRNLRLSGRSWVYFVQRGEDGPIKIGRTRQFSSRMSALRSCHPEELFVRGRIPEEIVSEDRLHGTFRKHRIRLEWFHPDPEILELAAAGDTIYAAGYTDEILPQHEELWHLIVSYRSIHDKPRLYTRRPKLIEERTASA